MKTRRTRTQWLADAGAVLCLVLPATFLVIAGQDQRVSSNPQTAIAVVDEKRLVDTGDTGPIFTEVRYSFTGASGGRFQGRGYVSQRVYDKLAVGDGIEIEYAADDPTLNHLRGGSNEAAIYYFGLSVVCIIWFWYFGPRRWFRLWLGEPDPILS